MNRRYYNYDTQCKGFWQRWTNFQEPRLIRSLFEIAEDATREEDLRCEARQCLALCGFQPHVKSRGINLLSIDGGGTRGMMGLEILEQLENKSGKKVSRFLIKQI